MSKIIIDLDADEATLKKELAELTEIVNKRCGIKSKKDEEEEYEKWKEEFRANTLYHKFVERCEETLGYLRDEQVHQVSINATVDVSISSYDDDEILNADNDDEILNADVHDIGLFEMTEALDYDFDLTKSEKVKSLLQEKHETAINLRKQIEAFAKANDLDFKKVWEFITDR